MHKFKVSCPVCFRLINIDVIKLRNVELTVHRWQFKHQKRCRRLWLDSLNEVGHYENWTFSLSLTIGKTNVDHIDCWFFSSIADRLFNREKKSIDCLNVIRMKMQIYRMFDCLLVRDIGKQRRRSTPSCWVFILQNARHQWLDEIVYYPSDYYADVRSVLISYTMI